MRGQAGDGSTSSGGTPPPRQQHGPLRVTVKGWRGGLPAPMVQTLVEALRRLPNEFSKGAQPLHVFFLWALTKLAVCSEATRVVCPLQGLNLQP